MKTALQKAMDQIGEEAVIKAIPAGAKLGRCDVHGAYLVMGEACCPICPDPNGMDATQVEHYINLREAVGIDGTNPQQKHL